MLDTGRARGSRVQLSRTAHQTKAERCNKMESEHLRQRMRLLDSELQRYSGVVYKEKQRVSRQLEETRQSTGHCPQAVMPEGKRDMTMIAKSPWFKEGQGRLSEKHLGKWRTTESELNRIFNVASERKEEMTQREKNKRLALVHFLKTAGLLDKKTKRVLLPFTQNISSNPSSDSEDEASTVSEIELDGVEKIKTQFPRVFAYCKDDAVRLRSAPSGTRRPLEEQFADLNVGRRTATASASRSRRAYVVQQHRTAARLRGRQVAFHPALLEEAEVGPEPDRRRADVDVEDGEEGIQGLELDEDDAFEAFSHLPQWKRELLMEAPMYVNSTTTENSAENVKAILSKSQIRRDMEEMRNENSKRSRLLHACNLKKVYLQ